jgi:hypothetical protein
MRSGTLRLSKWLLLSSRKIYQFSMELWLMARLAIGYFIAWGSYILPLRRQRAILKKDPDHPPELRLWWLLYSEFISHTMASLTNSRTPRDDRFVRFRMDIAWSTPCPLDRTYDLLFSSRYRQLLNLYVYH